MRGSFTRLFILAAAVIFTAGLGCEHDASAPAEADPRDTLPGSWVTWSPFDWDHDGYPVSGEFCKLYSDRVLRDKRPELLQFADNTFRKIMQEFQFLQTGHFLFPPGYNRIHINLSLDNAPGIAYAYWGSVLITVESINPDTTRLAYLMKHELTHVFEFLIEGRAELGTDVWFREGIAVYCGSNGGWDHISTVDDLHTWILKNENYVNGGNPISIHASKDYPEGSDITGYYTVFNAVMKYILDEQGMGKSYADIRELFYDVRTGLAFEDVFELHFGVNLQVFEEEIFERLEAWLEETDLL